MAQFYVNNVCVTTTENVKLIEFLRDTLRLTSVKNGCSEGACGTCMVIVDRKAQKACVLQTDKLEGKSITTVEGLSKREREIYSYAFASCGAVQCGFCTPGMVISAKALIDSNPAPSRDEVKKALRNNICRCTGYKKIEEAVLMAAEMLLNGTQVPKPQLDGGVGENLARVDAIAKTLGEAPYADDMYFDGMLYGSAVRSEYPRARVVNIDVSAAIAYPGVRAVVTADDIPGAKLIGHIIRDWDVLIPKGGMTHFRGDAIVLIAATTKKALEEAKKLVVVEYEELEPVFSPARALEEGAPLVQPGGNVLASEHLIRGDADATIKSSKYVVRNTYSTPFTEHAFLEPETAVAFMAGDTVRIFSGDQGVYQTQREVAAMMGYPLENVRVTACMVGGGFGGKEDQVVAHHAALLAYKAGAPVKVSLTRQESILVHPKRHPMELDVTTACDETGRLTAMKAVIIADTGAYASLGGPVLQRACTHAAGPYNYQVVDILGKAVYTNNPPAGPFRGFGVTQSCFATECNINQLAKMVGISPWEMRYRNAIRPGQVLPNGQIADESTALVETLQAVKDAYDKNPKAGLACAIKNSGVGVGLTDIGRCRLRVSGGLVHIYSSAACIGQGFGTVATQVLSEATGLPATCISYHVPDTHLSPNAGNTTASRQTLFTGEAVRNAGLKLLGELEECGRNLSKLDKKEYTGEYIGETDPMNSGKENPVSHVAYGYATHLVELDDDGKLKRVIAAHDVGRAINPNSLTGQIEGGVVMSLGFALTEDYPLKDGYPTVKFGTLGLFKSTDVPDIDVVVVEKSKSPLAYGAKGVGEISAIPTAPAVQLAYFNRDGIFRTRLPLENTPYTRKRR